MADYHPLIARAVAGLEKNTGENRRGLYERARSALVAQLRSVTPALDESEITRERLALEEAIRKVEAESARLAREQTRASPPPRPAAGRREELARVASAAAALPAAPDAAPPSAPAPASPSPETPAPSGRASLRTEDRPSLADEAIRGFRGVTESIQLHHQLPLPSAPATEARPSERPGRTERPERADRQERAERAERQDRSVQDRSIPDRSNLLQRPSITPPRAPGLPPAPNLPPSQRHPLEEFGQLEPRLQPEQSWSRPNEGGLSETVFDLDDPRSSPLRPRAPRHMEQESQFDRPPPRPRQRSWPSLPPQAYSRYGRIVGIGFLILLVGVLAFWQRDNIASAASGVMALFGGSSQTPREAATPARPKIVDRIGQPTAQQPGGPAVAQRVVLYEEDPDDAQGKRFTGTVVWRTEMVPPAPGRAPEMVVRADIRVPERNLNMTWSLRRNTDQSLPASHTVEVVFSLPPDSPSGGVQNVPGVLMKQAEQTRGVPLAGLAVKVTPGFFLLGLSALESDMQRNLQLLKDRGWFDIPIVYNNNRRAILAMEKGTPGERAFADAFAAWRQ